jgi:hypothetical protein
MAEDTETVIDIPPSHPPDILNINPNSTKYKLYTLWLYISIPIWCGITACFSIPHTLFTRLILHKPRNEKWTLRQEVAVSVLQRLIPTRLYFLRTLGNLPGPLSVRIVNECTKCIDVDVYLWDDRLYEEHVYDAVTTTGTLPSLNFNQIKQYNVKGYWFGNHNDMDAPCVLYAHGGGFVMGYVSVVCH